MLSKRGNWIHEHAPMPRQSWALHHSTTSLLLACPFSTPSFSNPIPLLAFSPTTHFPLLCPETHSPFSPGKIRRRHTPFKTSPLPHHVLPIDFGRRIAGIYMTLLSPLPSCLLSTAWTASQCQRTISPGLTLGILTIVLSNSKCGWVSGESSML